jgi:hypothetical protein
MEDQQAEGKALNSGLLRRELHKENTGLFIFNASTQVIPG